MDDGESWDVLGARKGMNATHVGGIGFDKTDGNLIYLGTDRGIFRSDNGGDTIINVLSTGYITDIEVSEDNPNIAFASYHPTYNSNQGVIYKSTDAGLSWTQSSTDLPADLRLLKVVSDAQDENTVFVLSGNGRFACGEAEVFRSTNGGVNWINITTTIKEVLDFTIDPNNSSNVFLTTMNADCSAQYYWTDLIGDLYVSSDQGTSWGAPLSDYTGVIWIDRNNSSTIRLIDPRQPYEWITRSGTWTSTNGGKIFTKTGDVLDWDTFYNDEVFHSYGKSPNGIVKTLSCDLANNDNYYWATNQFIHKTSTNGDTFVNVFTNEISPGHWQSRGIDNVNMMDLISSPADPSIVYAAYFDLGVWRSLDQGKSWQSCNVPQYTGAWSGKGGNGSTLLTDPERDSIVWVSLGRAQKGQDPTYLLKSGSAGDTSTWVESNMGLPKIELMGLSMDVNSPTNNRTIYITSQGDVYKSTDDGHSWNLVFNCDRCRFTAVDGINGDIIYAGGGAGLWLSRDAGITWLDISHSEMKATGTRKFWDWNYDGLFDVRTDPNNENTVYATAYGTDKGLYKSEDRGTSWTKLITQDFMRKVAIAPNDPDIVYATSSRAFKSGGHNEDSKGVYFSEDGGSSWIFQNHAMEYTYGFTVHVDNMEAPTVYVGSPGTGFQKALMPIDGSEHLLIENDCIEVFENPYQDQVIIKGDFENYEIKILDDNGNLEEELTGRASPIMIYLPNLGNGEFFISMQHLIDDDLCLKKRIK